MNGCYKWMYKQMDGWLTEINQVHDATYNDDDEDDGDEQEQCHAHGGPYSCSGSRKRHII